MDEEALQQFRKERADLLLDVLRELELVVLESALEGCFGEAVALEIQALLLLLLLILLLILTATTTTITITRCICNQSGRFDNYRTT